MSVSITVDGTVEGVAVSSAVLVAALAQVGIAARYDASSRTGLARQRGQGQPAARVVLGRRGGIPVGVSLARVDSALRVWDEAAGSRTVLLAGSRSFCAGVERAITAVQRALDRFGAPVYVRKEIVHNSHVVRDLRARGVVFVDELTQVPEGSLVVFSAHGVSPAVRAAAEARGLRVIDATCPLVSKVHAEARRFQRDGHQIVLIGHAGHEEVEGTMGHAPMHLVATAEDAARVPVPQQGSVAFLTQTTLAVDETAAVVDALRQRFPTLTPPPSDDICYATTNRQNAVQAMTGEVDLVLVVGSANSSNSVRLVDVARADSVPAYLIDDATGLDPAWLPGVRTVGLTAGASAPEHLVQGVIDALRDLGPVTVREHTPIVESVHFGLPKQVS